jgi:D-tyrosyl-tRNA(Tyr) deacylase
MHTAIYAIIPDCVEYGEWKTGLRNDGFQYAFVSLGNKIGMAIGTALLAALLGKYGYVANQVQNPEVIAVMKHAFSTIPGILWIVTAVVLFFYRLNKKRYNEIVEDLKNGKRGQCKSSIGKGMLILVGIEESDGQEDIDWLCKKIVNLRIFDDENGVMNKSILEDGGEILVISQFTLHASTKKGNRPSYIKAAKPEISVPLYERFCKDLSRALGKEIGTGTFGADMKVELLNDGPVTICMDTKNKE